jgi:hypothetical protein
VKRKPTILFAVALGALAGTLLCSAPQAAEQKATTRVPLPKVNITQQGEKCVEPTDVMRRSHMDFILHQRDQTMHRGIRTSKHSLKNCVNCHADPVTGSVLGKEGFCSSCHHYAAVHIDCFSCHTDKAEKKTSLLHPGRDDSQHLSDMIRHTMPDSGPTPLAEVKP